MNKPTIWALLFLLGGVPWAFGQATLPTFYSGPWSTTNLPTGWTKNGLGSDYATDYDGSGGNAAKFDSSGDFIQIFFSSAPSTVSYYARGNSLSGDYTYKVQESTNGSVWTDIAVYTSTNPLNNSTPVQYTNNLLSSSRYVQFIYVTKVTGNVGLDGVRVAGPGVPSVTFNPNGTTNAPVSNLFTMAISISPAGSGMQSWNLVPAYSGPASLTNGTFSFTPAAADSSKTFTLSVIATNAVGTSTGTASITVTAYVPPVPVVTFSPAAPYSIMATETQKLGIGVSPAGSGIQSWTLLPSNYAGSVTLVGTNFTFVTAQADGPADYTLSIIATNSFGATTGTASIAVSAYVPPPPPGAYIASFEDATKTGYAAGNVTLSNKVWELAGILIGTAAEDLKIGSKSARMKWSPSDGPETMTSQEKLLTNGISTISLWYGPYGTHGTNAPTVAVEISENLASGWVELGEIVVGAVTVLTFYSVDVYVSEPVYVRLRATSGVSDKSANLDNVMITPYTPPSTTAYDVFLLQYNVTPGDPGTATNENLDGDAFTNQEEYNAGTNPYDDAIHP